MVGSLTAISGRCADAVTTRGPNWPPSGSSRDCRDSRHSNDQVRAPPSERHAVHPDLPHQQEAAAEHENGKNEAGQRGTPHPARDPVQRYCDHH